MLQQKVELPRKSKLITLAPLMDNNGIIRVDGHLENAYIDYDSKHSIVLPAKHPFTDVVLYYYDIALHAGALAKHNVIRQKFCLIGDGRKTVRRIVQRCIVCLRFQHRKITPQMGQLPTDRLSPGYAFHTISVDYAGPFTIKIRGGRCRTTLKVYASIFMCFLIKAMHLEIVKTLTLVDFIAARRRFISWREHPSKIVSENGTQIVGTNLKFKEFFQGHQDEIVNFGTVLQIE